MICNLYNKIVTKKTIMDRLEKIAKLAKKKKELENLIKNYEKELEKLYVDLIKVKISYREMRLEKSPKDNKFDYRLTCVCGNEYSTNKNPNSAGDDRPQCKKCTVRFEKPIIVLGAVKK